MPNYFNIRHISRRLKEIKRKMRTEKRRCQPVKEVIRKPIMQNLNLTCLQTDKFKTGVFSVMLLSELNKENASKNALLPYVLRRGTARYNDMKSISAALDLMYGARIEPVIRKMGEVQAIGFYADFPDDYFIPGNEHILERVVDLAGEMLIAPTTKSGMLLNEYVTGEKEHLTDEINAILNDKRAYANMRLTELMCARESYGVGRLGKASSVRRITASALTKHYRKLLKQAPVEIFYCGSAAPERVESAVAASFASLPRSGMMEIPETNVVTEPEKQQIRIFEEKMDVTQGKLSIGFRLGDNMLSPNYPAIMVFNALYGASPTSKLFENVREKLSLCYYASSSVDKYKGIMTVSAGIEPEKFEVAKNEIFAQLEAVKGGKVDENELESAKKTVINSLRSAMDQPEALENIYLGNAVLDIQLSPDIAAGLADNVTKEDVIKIASGITADSIYFLTMNGGNKDEN